MKSDGTVTVFEGSVEVYDVTSDENNLGNIANDEGRTITGSTDDYSNYDQTKEPIEANLPIGKNCELVDGLVICNGEYADCEFEVKYQTPGLKSECLGGQQIDQMPIYAYAPYNDFSPSITGENPATGVNRANVNSKLLKLFTLTGSQDADSFYDNWPDEKYIYNVGKEESGIKGAIMNNVDTDDYIKYSNLNLSSDFAIEMSVQFPSLPIPTTTRYLFQLGDYKAYLFFNGKIYLQNSILIKSGNSRHIGHLSKRGSSLAKHALYMSSVSCLLHNDQLKQLYDTKRSGGKSRKEALVVVSRKLAGIIYAIFRYNTPYDPTRVFTVKSGQGNVKDHKLVLLLVIVDQTDLIFKALALKSLISTHQSKCLEHQTSQEIDSGVFFLNSVSIR